jgi:leucine-rich repeat protein SHOC2
VGTLSSLKVLEADENNIRTLPENIGNCKSLERLVLTSNHIEMLPTDIGNLKGVKQFYVGENNIYSVPPHIGMMDSLIELYINDNLELHKLPMELSYCKSLQILSIEGCPLSDIPQAGYKFIMRVIFVILPFVVIL